MIMATLAFACNNVEEGLDPEYAESTADFTVELLTPDRGAINDTISYSVTVSANSDIQSLFVQAKSSTDIISGDSGTEFEVSDDNDPFIDHAYGTIQSGTNSISLIYNYVISQDSTDLDMIFTMVDETGIQRDTMEVATVPSFTTYDDIVLYSQSNSDADGLSTADGTVYHDLAEYEDYTTVNVAIQQSVDIVFIANDESAVITCPYNTTLDVDFSETNKTLFVLLEEVSSDDFDALTTASLSSFTEDYEVKKGATSLSDVQVGDIIGFRTDYNSSNSYHYGILRITAMHPTTVDYYDGMSYQLEMDVKVQQSSNE